MLKVKYNSELLLTNHYYEEVYLPDAINYLYKKTPICKNSLHKLLTSNLHSKSLDFIFTIQSRTKCLLRNIH